MTLLQFAQVHKWMRNAPFTVGCASLNRLREGNQTERDTEILKTRVLQNNASQLSPDLIEKTHLFATNKAVDYHNSAIFDACENQKCHIKAIDIVVGDMPDNLKEKILRKIPNEPSKTMGLHSVIRIAVYLPYDITANVSVTDGMTNGVECRIMKIDYRVTGSQRPSILWVLFPDQSIGSECRREYAHLYNSQIESTWTPLLEITKQFSITRNANIRIL